MTALDKAALVALAERVEALTGDRETALLEAVLRAVGWTTDDTGRAIMPDGTHCYGPLPNPLASLDAAMTLVPEGADYALERVHGADWASIDVEGQRRPPICAATPALALTAAALRALAAQETAA